MTTKTLKIGDSEDMWLWDDAASPTAIWTDGDIDAPNIASTESVTLLSGRVTTVEGKVETLEGKVSTIEGTLATGVSGTFTTVDDKTVTVTDGLITAIV